LGISEHIEHGLGQLSGQNAPSVGPHLKAPLEAFLALLTKWNRVYNLTAVRDPAQMVDRHLMDSLMMSRWLPEATEPDTADFDVMDIGSGAGLPVLPLAIARPDLRFASIESNGKKTRFQQQCLVELSLQNVTVINDRVENIGQTAHVVMSRAFTAPADFLAIAEPLCAKNGAVAVMLGLAERMPGDLPEAYKLEELVKLQVPGAESERHVALCRRQ